LAFFSEYSAFRRRKRGVEVANFSLINLFWFVLILFYRIWTPSSGYMILMAVELSTIMNFQMDSFKSQPQVDHHPKLVVLVVLAQAQNNSLRS
jgi:hypothetical protein